MYLLNERYEPITAIDQNTLNVGEHYYWEYDFNMSDFYLTTSLAWYNLKQPTYQLKIGNALLELPEDFFFLIGDVGVGLDSLKPEEMVGRGFDAFVFDRKIKTNSWSLQEVNVIGYKEESELVFPRTKNPVVVGVGDRYAMLVSEINMYTKIKNKGFNDIV